MDDCVKKDGFCNGGRHEFKDVYTVPELLKLFQKIRLLKTSNGDLILNNVTEKDKVSAAK